MKVKQILITGFVAGVGSASVLSIIIMVASMKVFSNILSHTDLMIFLQGMLLISISTFLIFPYVGLKYNLFEDFLTS